MSQTIAEQFIQKKGEPLDINGKKIVMSHRIEGKRQTQPTFYLTANHEKIRATQSNRRLPHVEQRAASKGMVRT
ncbi:hypothetical protein, partial [Paenibacillus puerhi]|uniref:hypothetical protein n=1 Tax=Paenibacillus puerhi TaxID=2692622 RepID=UPI001F2216C7